MDSDLLREALEIGPQIVYSMAKNPQEARIST